MIRGVLHRSRIEARDWLIFGLAILLPLAMAAVVGYRALDNEAAARQRETEVELADAARQLGAQVQGDIAAAQKRLGSATLPADFAAAARSVERVMPPFAVAVVLSSDGELRVPRATTRAEPTAECERAAKRISEPQKPDERTKLARHLVEACPDARSVSGRLLFPILALGDAAHVPPAKLSAWLEAHSQSMSALERDAMRDDLAHAQLDEETKQHGLELLARPRADVGQWLATPEARRAVAELGTDTPLVRFEGEGVIGVLRRVDAGPIAGFLVTQESLGRGRFALPADLAVGKNTSGAHSVADIGKGLRLSIGLTDPRHVEHLTAQSRRWLTASGVVMAALALAFGALALSRMRATRRLGELRTDFVSAVSHELRTPIASLRMLAELLEQDRVEADERTEVYTALAEEARRLGDTVDRLLSFSRMTAGRAVLTRQRTRVAEPVLASLKAFELSHPGVDVEREIDAKVEADIDADQVRLAVDNLLENALKYAPEGQPYRLVVAATRNHEVTISVEDHGPGVAPRDRKRIFEPFERADDRLSRATEGSGIGLGLVRHVAKAHGGRAWVESELGRGARFLITLPRGVA